MVIEVFVLFFFHLVVRCGIEGAEFYPAMQDKTRITPVLARVLCTSVTCVLRYCDGEIVCISLERRNVEERTR